MGGDSAGGIYKQQGPGEEVRRVAAALSAHGRFQPLQRLGAPTLSPSRLLTWTCRLCLMVLNSSQKPDLIRATLATLHAFLSWVPLGYIFESNVIEVGVGGAALACVPSC